MLTRVDPFTVRPCAAVCCPCQVVAFEDFKSLATSKSMAEVKAAGKYRQEGKTYEVVDGDIIHFQVRGAGWCAWHTCAVGAHRGWAGGRWAERVRFCSLTGVSGVGRAATCSPLVSP